MLFTVKGFVEQAKAAMASTENVAEQQRLVKELMMKVLSENSFAELERILEASVPPGASISEMIVHADEDLTVLWAQISPRFQSAIHNHTVWAIIAPFYGIERNTLFEQVSSDQIQQARVVDVEPGQVLELAPNAIHCIENLSDQPAKALHCYGGNFRALDHVRDLWTWSDKTRMDFSFPNVLNESVELMRLERNRMGLEALAAAIPKTAVLVEQALQDIN
jgi:predicted metal-dependent enzyme (double-stranded beta helix superfamily)